MKTSRNAARNRFNNVIIPTKLQMPPLKTNLLPRTHLVDRLETGRHCRLFVVTGSVGSGKTCLVSQWLERDGLSAVWYALDESDNDSDMFLRYLLAALSAIDRRVASGVKLWLQSRKRLSWREIIAPCIEHLARLSEDIYLVFEDYHFITSGEIHDGLSRFLQYIPPKMHVVITSRYCLPFSLCPFKVKNQIIEITMEDLKFTEEEVKQFLTEIMHVQLSNDQAQELARWTEGWIGGLQLLGLSLKGTNVRDRLDETLSKACWEITDYLVDQVLNVQPEKVKTFLHKTALLDRFTPELCQDVTGLPDTVDILDYIYRNHLFLIPLDTKQEWFRYHHLFSEALRNYIKKSLPDVSTEVYRKAALWFAQNGYLQDALRYAFSSEDFEFAADLMEDSMFHLYGGYEVPFVLDWLVKLPRLVLMQRGLLRLMECNSKIESLQLLEAEVILTDINGNPDQMMRYREPKKSLCQHLLKFYGNVISYYRDPGASGLSRLKETVQSKLPREFCFGFLKDLVTPRHLLKEDLSLPYTLLLETAKTGLSLRNVLNEVCWAKAMSNAERLQGRMRRAESLLQDALLFLDQKGMSGTNLSLILNLPFAWIFYLHNDVEKALEYVSIALRSATQRHCVNDIIEGNLALYPILMARGEAEKAGQCRQNLQLIAERISDPSITAFSDAVAIPYAIAQGDVREAERWADRRNLRIDEPFSFLFVHECLAQAHVLNRQARYQEASHMLNGLRGRCAERGLMEEVLNIDLLNSHVYYALGDRDSAMAIMKQAIDFAESEGYIRFFIDYAPIVSQVLTDIAMESLNGRLSPVFTTIMNACNIKQYAFQSPIEVKRNGYLTPREVEILDLMAKGLRDKEIAQRTFLSLYTVKTHAKHIFQKLNVTSRTQAIRSAEVFLKPTSNQERFCLQCKCAIRA